jgi:tRNA threonylcarbamoyladenosine modification (KEOPS) complex  Pcc1 subunit
MYHSTIEFSSDDSDKLLKAVEAELKSDAKRDRSSWDVKKDGKRIIFNIDASDATALRATLSSLTQLLSVFEKAKSVVREK